MSTNIPAPSERPPDQAGIVEDMKRRILEGDEELPVSEPKPPKPMEESRGSYIPSPSQVPPPAPESWLKNAGYPIDFSVVNGGFRINLKARVLGRHNTAFLLVLPITCGFEPSFTAEFDATLGAEKLKLAYLDHYYEFKKDGVIIVGFQILETYATNES